MTKIKMFFNNYVSFPDIIRQVILSWMIAVAIEYYRLPSELRDLSAKDGLGQMSVGLVLLLTVCFTGVLFTLSCFVNSRRWERWGMAAVFAIVAVGTFSSKASAAYYIICALIFGFFVVFGLYGWKNNDD